MTEDDTFFRLKRMPFKQVMLDWGKSPSVHLDQDERDKFFEDHGWTWLEYITKYDKIIPSNIFDRTKQIWIKGKGAVDV